MAEISRPWDGTSTGDAGPYSAANWQANWAYSMGLGGGRANIGPLLGSGTSPSDGLKVTEHTPNAASVDMGIGSALVQGIWYFNSAALNLAIGANASGNPRIDTVVLRADYSLQTVRARVLPGTPAGSPTPPALTQVAGTTWDIPIADIAVANGFVTITNANITPRQEWINAANGVYLDNILNNSGVTLETGNVVVWDTTADRAAKTTTTLDDKNVAGVWVGRTSNGGYGRVLRFGVGYVLASAAVTRGDLLVTSATATKADKVVNNALSARLGMALETTGGAGLALALINVSVKGFYPVLVQDSKSSGTAPASVTASAWRTRELTTLVSDPGSLASVGSNQITLAAGDYLAYASAEGTLVGSTHVDRLRLRNVTDNTTLVQGNNSGLTPANIATNMVLYGYFRLTAQKVIELQHYPSGTGNAGTATSTGENEIYANVFLVQIGS